MVDKRRQTITGTQEPELYRYGIHGYDFWVNLTVGPGKYDLRLAFANTRGLDTQQYCFDILINGRKVAQQVDVTATAGGTNKAVDLIFKNIAPSNGVIEVHFQRISVAGGRCRPARRSICAGVGNRRKPARRGRQADFILAETLMNRRTPFFASRFVLAIILPVLACADDAINLGSRRELFVDRFLIDQLKGAELRMHEPIREGVAVKFDNPWEGMYSGYATVIKDGAVYRMYYRGLPVTGQDGSADAVVAYAESKDGMAWTKPDLGLFTVRGTRHNNVVLTNAPYTHNFSPLRDENPEAATAARYKALGGTQVSGLHAFQSADGIHWSVLQAQAVFTKGVFDSQNVAFWSVTEGQYVCYFRTWKTVKGKPYRWISRTTSKDFIHWTEPVEMDFGDTPPEEFYTNGTHPYYRAPHIYIALAKRFFPDKAALPEEQAETLVQEPDYRVASSDSIFMTTRGGSHYERTFLEAFIRPGPTPEDWIARDNAPAQGGAGERARDVYLSVVALRAAQQPHGPIPVAHGWFYFCSCALWRRGIDHQAVQVLGQQPGA